VGLEVVVDSSARDHRLRLVVRDGRAWSRALRSHDVRHHRTSRAGDRVVPAASGGRRRSTSPKKGPSFFITVVRAAGWLSRLDLESQREPAGPGSRTPEPQSLGATRARLALTSGPNPQMEAWAAEPGLRAVPPDLSAPQPEADGNGLVARNGAVPLERFLKCGSTRSNPNKADRFDRRQ